MILPKLEFIYDRKGRAGKGKPASVELRVYADRKQKYITTGVKLLPREWSNGEVSSCRKDYKEQNELLHTFKKKCLEIVTAMIDQGNLDLNALPSLMRDGMTSRETFINYAKGIAARRYRTISKGTQRHYQVFFKFLEEWKGIVYFSDMTEQNVQKMDDVLTDRGLKECSRYNYHKLLKSFAIQAVEDGLIKKNPYSKLDIRKGNESGLTRYLTPKEFHKFEQVEIEDECLARVRDIFVFQTYTMMAYADLAAFDWKNCAKVDGNIIYKAKRQKTNQEFVIVLLPQALSILKKYNNKLPIISNVKYNLYLKAAVRYAKIDKPVTTHWARHTGATMMVNDGISMQIVQHILGHASIRETERTYAKILDRTIVDTMASFGNGTKKGRD